MRLGKKKKMPLPLPPRPKKKKNLHTKWQWPFKEAHVLFMMLQIFQYFMFSSESC